MKEESDTSIKKKRNSSEWKRKLVVTNTEKKESYSRKGKVRLKISTAMKKIYTPILFEVNSVGRMIPCIGVKRNNKKHTDIN